MKRMLFAATVGGFLFITAQGCTNGSILPTGNNSDPAAVAAKAENVASRIGGDNGFGGSQMANYMQQAMPHMGFNTVADLAEPGSMMTVQLHNQSPLDCTFHLSYFSSQENPSDQAQDINVPAGGDATVQIPCSEIVGAGPLDTPGAAGCVLSDGRQISNIMTIPAFMGMDYNCGSVYHMYLTPDVNDLNGNANTNELILMSQAMQTHMMSGGGMMGYLGGPGMMMN